ncbi:MAG: hypothetical protein JNG86_06290 [Verrucomicrobiaceae bacterium]|nr:hypothetical protein [Verrucomicrobiaceae bacterium]
MNRLVAIITCLTAGCLCSCAGGEGKKKSKPLDEVKLGQRLNKPDTSQRSHYEKFMSKSVDGRGSAGMQFQNQMFRTSKVAGLNEASGMGGQYKTKESMFSRLKFWDKSTFKTDQAGGIASKAFDTGDAFKTGEAGEGSKIFSGADDVFGTKQALSRSDRVGQAPKIIENRSNSGTTGSYTEDEVKRILNRN